MALLYLFFSKIANLIVLYHLKIDLYITTNIYLYYLNVLVFKISNILQNIT
jgi:hypothetical protein